MFVSANKCESCGAKLNIDPTKSSGSCPYCGTAFINHNVTQNTTSFAPPPVTNAPPMSEPKKTYIPPRPKLNGCLAVFLCFIYVIPGVIYILYTMQQQTEWDKKYRK